MSGKLSLMYMLHITCLLYYTYVLYSVILQCNSYICVSWDIYSEDVLKIYLYSKRYSWYVLRSKKVVHRNNS